MAEQTETGVYNVLGPGGSMGLCEMLGAIRGLFGTPMKLTWVSIPWVGAQDIVDPEAASWSIWRFSRDLKIRSDKALAKGLTYRPLSVTARDALDWYKSQPPAERAGFSTGLKVDDLSALRVHTVITPWKDILDRESEILARWRAHQSHL
jgi:hypothetical protein